MQIIAIKKQVVISPFSAVKGLCRPCSAYDIVAIYLYNYLTAAWLEMRLFYLCFFGLTKRNQIATICQNLLFYIIMHVKRYYHKLFKNRAGRDIVKKEWLLLIAMLFLSACGGGSSGTDGGSGSVKNDQTNDPGTTPSAMVSIIVTDSASANGVAMGSMLAAPTMPTMTMARISITNPSVNGISYKQIQSIAIPGTTTLSVPIASGYTFELVTYIPGTRNYIGQYAQTQNVQIQAGSNSVTLALSPITSLLTVDPATAIVTGQSYTVSVNYSAPTPLQSMWYISNRTTDFTQPLHLTGTYSYLPTVKLVAPVNNNLPGTLYFQGEFFIKSSLLNTSESYYNWVFVYPNPMWGDSPISVPLEVPSGDVTITFP